MSIFLSCFLYHRRVAVNAFSIIMNAQHELARNEEPRIYKQGNDVIKFLMEKQCQWRGNEVSSFIRI